MMQSRDLPGTRAACSGSRQGHVQALQERWGPFGAVQLWAAQVHERTQLWDGSFHHPLSCIFIPKSLPVHLCPQPHARGPCQPRAQPAPCPASPIPCQPHTLPAPCPASPRAMGFPGRPGPPAEQGAGGSELRCRRDEAKLGQQGLQRGGGVTSGTRHVAAAALRQRFPGKVEDVTCQAALQCLRVSSARGSAVLLRGTDGSQPPQG